MWSCKYDMAVVSCSSLSVCGLINPPQPLLCLLTLLLSSSWSLIIVSYNVNMWLFLSSCPAPAVLLCLFLCHVCTSLSRCLFVFVGSFWQHLVGWWLIWVHHGLHSYSMQYMRVQGNEPGPRLWFNTHTPTDRGLGESMCWWKSNVLCLQGTACFSLSLPRLQNLVSHTNLGPLLLKTAPPNAFLSVCLCLSHYISEGKAWLRSHHVYKEKDLSA